MGKIKPAARVFGRRISNGVSEQPRYEIEAGRSSKVIVLRTIMRVPRNHAAAAIAADTKLITSARFLSLPGLIFCFVFMSHDWLLPSRDLTPAQGVRCFSAAQEAIIAGYKDEN
jgi:hypothetical protein